MYITSLCSNNLLFHNLKGKNTKRECLRTGFVGEHLGLINRKLKKLKNFKMCLFSVIFISIMMASFEKGSGTQRVAQISVGEGCYLYQCQEKVRGRRSGFRPS
jgi:hypothetical protein